MSLIVTNEIAAFLKKKSPELSQLIDQVGLMSIKTTGRIFPDLVSCMIGQMISTKAASTIEGRFVDLVHEVTPEHILKVDIASIKAMFVQDTGYAYKILEIGPEASDEEVKKAYRRMAMKYHPDKLANMGEDIQQAAQEKFRKVSEAYQSIKKERNIA